MKLHPYIKYRSDIDGLRAVAVLSVILFHINAKWIPGGFLGVDIFFVISGYLITLILTKEVASTNKVNIINFYKRRIKRIIPALLFVLIPTFIIGFLYFTPDDLLELSKSMVWAFFSAANIYFFASIDTGYFATGSSELPLLHLWSLGVEEQFYILWPFVILYLLRYIPSVKKQLLLVSLLFMGSLIWAQLIIVENHSFAYYMLPTRSWELLAGSFTALLVHSGFRTSNLINNLMAFIGLVSIILSLIFVSESDPVPGVAALPTIIGTTLLILSGVSYKTYVGRILSLKIFVAIGLVSYSAYLWHWPILAFIHYALIDIDLKVAAIVMILTFILATISFFFIESPLRKNEVSTINVFIWYFIVPSILIATISLFTDYAIKHKNKHIYPWSELNRQNLLIKSANAYKYNCQYSNFNSSVYKEQRCSYPSTINRNYTDAILIGDSNGAHYLGMLRVFAKQYRFSLRNVTQSSCPILFSEEIDWMYPKYKKGCSIYRSYIKKQIINYDTIIIGINGPDYMKRKNFENEFENTVNQISKQAKTVILLAKVPVFPKYNKECKKRSIRIKVLNCSDMFNKNQKDHKYNHFIKQLSEKYTNIYYFNPRLQLCTGNECTPYIDNKPIYYNPTHLSMKGSELLGNKMIQTKDPMINIFRQINNLKIYKKD